MNAPIQSQLQHNDDEISLIDLLMVLTRHKKLMAGVFILCVGTSLAAALLREAKYTYSSSIEIGSIAEQGEKGQSLRLIDNPATLQAKIQEGYIPLVLHDFGKEGMTKQTFAISARVPKGSSLVVIEAKASADDGDIVKRLENSVIQLVKADHARMLDVVKSDINEELTNEQRNLEAQLDTQKVIKAKLEHNKALAKLLEKQVNEANTQIADIVANRKKARAMNGNEARAMTLLMLDNELEQNRQWLATLEERMQILIPTENDSLNKELADSSRKQEGIQAKIAQLQLKLRNIQETRAIIEPTRSIEPVGVSKAVIAILGVFLGAMLAMFAAFVAEIVGRVRKEIAMHSQ